MVNKLKPEFARKLKQIEKQRKIPVSDFARHVGLK
jgi:hypothetical protein